MGNFAKTSYQLLLKLHLLFDKKNTPVRENRKISSAGVLFWLKAKFLIWRAKLRSYWKNQQRSIFIGLQFQNWNLMVVVVLSWDWDLSVIDSISLLYEGFISTNFSEDMADHGYDSQESRRNSRVAGINYFQDVFVYFIAFFHFSSNVLLMHILNFLMRIELHVRFERLSTIFLLRDSKFCHSDEGLKNIAIKSNFD